MPPIREVASPRQRQRDTDGLVWVRDWVFAGDVDIATSLTLIAMTGGWGISPSPQPSPIKGEGDGLGSRE